MRVVSFYLSLAGLGKVYIVLLIPGHLKISTEKKDIKNAELHHSEVNFMPVLNDNKPINANETAERPWRCFQSKRDPFISLERAFDHRP